MSQDPNTPQNADPPEDVSAAAPGPADAAPAGPGAPRETAPPPTDAAPAAAPLGPGEGAQSGTAVETAPTASDAGAHALELPDFEAAAEREPVHGLELLDDVDLNVKIELGRTEMYVEDVLRLSVGSVVELDKLAGDPVDIYVNERLIGRGEVLVLNDSFCVRVNEILSPVPEREA